MLSICPSCLIGLYEDAEEVGKKNLLKCSGCHSPAILYCSTECQKIDWKDPMRGVHGIKNHYGAERGSKCDQINEFLNQD